MILYFLFGYVGGGGRYLLLLTKKTPPPIAFETQGYAKPVVSLILTKGFNGHNDKETINKILKI